MNKHSRMTTGLGLAGMAAAAILLAGCNQKTEPPADAKKSSSFSSQVESVAKKVEKSADTAMDKTQSAMNTAGDKVEAVADKTKVAISDTAITTAVKSKFIADPDLKAIDINVETVNGAVMLKGNVDTERNRDRATAVAKDIDGVKSVSNALVIGKK
jgi:osmotically-inducible protein OsmY